MVVVEHFVANGVVVEGVDCEVSSRGVLVLLPKDVVAKHPSVFIDVDIIGL